MAKASRPDDSPDYLLSPQLSLLGGAEVVGFGTDRFHVREIPRPLADDLIVANHYSGKVVKNSRVHLGVIAEGALMGVLQLGYALNAHQVCHVVANTTLTGYLELNRMWLDDALPRNSESRAFSYAVRYLRRRLPAFRWIQSFADERCGRLGVVY